jgi:protein TonB
MASSKELAPLLPETLPEDFNDWDGKASAAPAPVKSGEREAWEAADSFSETATPLWKSADSEALLASLVDGPRDSGSASPASMFVKQQEEHIDWENEAGPASRPADRTEWDVWEAAHSFSKRQKSPAPSTDREAFLAPVVDKTRDSGSAASAPVIGKQQELTNELADGTSSRDSGEPEAHHATNEVPVAAGSPKAGAVDGVHTSPEATGTTRRKSDEAVFQLFSAKKTEVKEEQKPAKKKWMIIAGASTCAVLLPLGLMIPVLRHGTNSAEKHSVQPLPGASYTRVTTSAPDTPNTQDTPNTAASKPPAQGKPLPATQQQKATDDPPSKDEEGATSEQVQSTMMNDQLAAPTRIPKQEAENSPPAGSDTAGAEGLGGGNANAGIFNGHSQPTVKVTRPVPISSGIATGMLIQSPPPVYPPLAKSANVAGTVELHATIATNGTIKDLRAVNGPVMLRQAAIEAVRNWRYQPYKLNNQPVEVETTINIVFTLGR